MNMTPEQTTEAKLPTNDLRYLPGLAQYILGQKLEEFIRLQIHISTKEVQIPLLQFFTDLSEEQLYSLSKQGAIKLLDALAANNTPAYINESIEQWQTNQLPMISKNDIVAEDITYITYVRKKAFLYFIPDYCTTTEQILETVKELDFFLMELETALANTHISLLKSKISEHAHFIEKITNTSPGIIYVYDVINDREVYANRSTADFLGYTPEEITGMGSNFVPGHIHPDDMPLLKQYEKEFASTKDGEIRSFSYRFKTKNQQYRWLRTFETVFRRNNEGSITEKIGIAIDVHEQKATAEKLHKRESELLEAQKLAQIGSFTWDFPANNSTATPQTYEILEISPDDFESFYKKVHPEDLQKVQSQIEQSLKTGIFDCEFRYRGEKEEKVIWSRGKVSFKEGKPLCMNGTIMDITERQRLLEKAKRSEHLYKQAEVLANMGTWSLDIATGKLQWTDQLYKIYGLEPQSEEITVERFISFVHPDDRQRIKDSIPLIQQQKNLDDTFRIVTQDGKIKTLRSIAQVQLNEAEEVSVIIGTERDITEKQNLINQLKRNEALYKQAQALSHVGNWSLDAATGRVEGSDEFYRIIGMQPQTAPLTVTQCIALLPKEELEGARATVLQAIKNQAPFDFFLKMHDENGSLKAVHIRGEALTDENGSAVTLIGTAQDVTERQQLIEKLQASEKLNKQAQSLAKLGNWTMDLKTNEFSWSDEMYNIYELEKGAPFTIAAWEKYIHPEDKDKILHYLQECIANKHPYDMVHRIVLPNGTVKTLNRKGELIIDKNGEVVKMLGTTQDITEESQIEQELRENQNFIRKITDATPSIITTYNVNTGQYVFVSEGLEKLLGYTTGDVMEKGVNFFVNIVHPEDLPGLTEKNTRVLNEANLHPEKNDIVSEFTYRMRHKNGHYRWFHTYGTVFDRNHEGAVEHVLNITLDITDQKEAIRKLEEQEYFIQQIADASPTILYLFDVEKGSMIYMNREIFFVLGYLPEEVVELGEDVLSLYHPDDYHLLPERRNSGKHFQQVDSMIQYECRMKHKEGDWRWFLVREIVFKVDHEGNIKQILGAALDINRRKDMEKTILQNAMLLEQSNASLEEFAYVASHDLKEPLRKISTFGDRLVATQQDALTPEGKIYLNKIVDASQRMQTMISDLLSISMISGNKSFERYSLQKIMDETLQTLEYKIEQQNAIIRYDVLPEANIIPSQFRQLFQNLLSNSLKFVKEGVQPVITVTHSYLPPADVMKFHLKHAERYLKIEFRDNGIGFENEFAGKIFAIFQRLHGRSEYEGSGIGLAICKKIVEHHGGAIFAQGTLDVGAVFTIILPL